MLPPNPVRLRVEYISFTPQIYFELANSEN
jgi:hypothetical protein